MADRQNIRLNLVNPSSSVDRPTLRLEQKPWGANTGKVDKAAFINYLGGLMTEDYYDNDEESPFYADTNCGVVDSMSDVTIYAYPSVKSLRYRIGASYGELSAGSVDEFYHLEMINLSLQDEVSTDYPAQVIIDAKPRGDLYDSKGGVVATPSISIVGDKIKLDRKVYGTIAVLYTVFRYVYTLNITVRPIETTTENYLSSVVYAWWDGDGTYLEVEPPPGAEDMLGANLTCGHGKTVFGDDDDKKKVPTAAYADQNKTIRYCDGVIIGESIIERTEWGDA